MAIMLALGMPLTYDKKGTIKMHKPQVGPTSTTDFLGEIMTQQICQTEIPTEISTDITCGEEVQVKTKYLTYVCFFVNGMRFASMQMILMSEVPNELC